MISSGGLSGINYLSIFLNVLLSTWLDLDLLISKIILWVKVNLKDLTFDSHIDSISNNVSKSSGFIIRCTKNMSPNTMLNLYKALILPHIIYCACVWAPYQRNHLDWLEKVQRKVAQTLFFKQSPFAEVCPPYSDRLLDLDLVRVEDAFKIQRLNLGFKILNDLAPASLWFYDST